MRIQITDFSAVTCRCACSSVIREKRVSVRSYIIPKNFDFKIEPPDPGVTADGFSFSYANTSVYGETGGVGFAPFTPENPAATGILEFVNNNMVGALKVVSVERGYDPSDFVLVAFGGAGPMHAAELASRGTCSWTWRSSCRTSSQGRGSPDRTDLVASVCSSARTQPASMRA